MAHEQRDGSPCHFTVRQNRPTYMGVIMKFQPILNSALLTFDQVAYRLDDYGIVRNVNRHQVIAYLMAEQKRLEGEVDSLKARVDFRRVQAEELVERAQSAARGGVQLALAPARYTLTSVRRMLGQA